MYFHNEKELYFIWFFWVVSLTTLAELEREDQISFIEKCKKNFTFTYYILSCKYLGKNQTVQSLWFERTDPWPQKHGSSMVSHARAVSGLCFQLFDVKQPLFETLQYLINKTVLSDEVKKQTVWIKLDMQVVYESVWT